MTRTFTPTHEIWTDFRMNDYVGSGIYATLTWDTRCQAPSHLYGHMSGRCVRCGAEPHVEYQKRT